MISKGCLVRTPPPYSDRRETSVCLVISDIWVDSQGAVLVDLLVSGTNEVRQYYVDRLQVISQ